MVNIGCLQAGTLEAMCSALPKAGWDGLSYMPAEGRDLYLRFVRWADVSARAESEGRVNEEWHPARVDEALGRALALNKPAGDRALALTILHPLFCAA